MTIEWKDKFPYNREDYRLENYRIDQPSDYGPPMASLVQRFGPPPHSDERGERYDYTVRETFYCPECGKRIVAAKMEAVSKQTMIMSLKQAKDLPIGYLLISAHDELLRLRGTLGKVQSENHAYRIDAQSARWRRFCDAWGYIARVHYAQIEALLDPGKEH